MFCVCVWRERERERGKWRNPGVAIGENEVRMGFALLIERVHMLFRGTHYYRNNPLILYTLSHDVAAKVRLLVRFARIECILLILVLGFSWFFFFLVRVLGFSLVGAHAQLVPNNQVVSILGPSGYKTLTNWEY